MERRGGNNEADGKGGEAALKKKIKSKKGRYFLVMAKRQKA